MTLDNVLINIQIKEENRWRDQEDKAKEICSKANVVKDAAFPTKKQKVDNKNFMTNKKPTFQEERKLFCVW